MSWVLVWLKSISLINEATIRLFCHRSEKTCVNHIRELV